MHAHTHGHMHVFAAKISKNRFFSMTQFLFSCKRGEKNTLRSPPLLLLHGVTELYVTGVQMGSGTKNTLELHQRKAYGEQLLQESVEELLWQLDQHACA